MPKPLPAGSHTFRDIIRGGFLYVDKTQYLYDLVRHEKGIYFLSRPRRFGKSITISTLEEIFKGEKEIFRDFWIYQSDYTWPVHPIIRLDFSEERVQTAEQLEDAISVFLGRIATKHQLTLPEASYQRQFHYLIEELAARGAAEDKKVVILIDEYDKPIVDNIQNLPEAIRIRERLKSFYGIIKALERHIRFVFITGISKFSRVGIFSDLNNLTDLTMSPDFATAFGITDEELIANFQEYITKLAGKEGLTEEALLAKIRDWYDGFRFVEDAPSVYNPYSTLLLFFHQRFSNYWFETGTPTFLIKLLKEQGYELEQLQSLRLSELAFSTYELEQLAIAPLLFQTGYLTIKEYDHTRRLYTLSYPNQEVENAFLAYLLGAFSERDRSLNDDYLWKLIDALEANQPKQFFTIINIFFANIPYNIHLKHEKYYQSLFFLIFKLLGSRIEVEVSTNEGRIDAVIEIIDRIFLFEFKLDSTADEALTQIKDNHYYEKYLLHGKPLTLLGANFDSAKRKVTAWKSEAAQQN